MFAEKINVLQANTNGKTNVLSTIIFLAKKGPKSQMQKSFRKKTLPNVSPCTYIQSQHLKKDITFLVISPYCRACIVFYVVRECSETKEYEIFIYKAVFIFSETTVALVFCFHIVLFKNIYCVVSCLVCNKKLSEIVSPPNENPRIFETQISIENKTPFISCPENKLISGQGLQGNTTPRFYFLNYMVSKNPH